jgi:patatin-related protein
LEREAPVVNPAFEPEQEVRFAVVMYGGVSLAIYINGVAQELFRLVRATAPARQYAESEKRDLENRVFYPDAALDGSERVYRELGRMLNLSGGPPGDAIRTRFVVDIISGTSAGGINGVLLGLALAQQKDFTQSADLWRKVAGIDELLREERSFEDLPPDTPRDSESLLNGYRLYFKAREAMAGMKAESPDDPWRPAFVEQLDLAVTTTDLAGLSLPVRLTETRSIDELTHRKVLRFSYGTPETSGERHTDFEGLDLMLGFAARSTSSFPFAFEPVLLGDLTRLDTGAQPPLERFFRDDLRVGRDPAKLAYADGGYLDNKPFSYATEALRRRRADVPVTRKLVYIEPHPVNEAARAAPTRERPDVIENVAASVLLPRHETIREDVAAVAQRNIAVERLQELGLFAERALDVEDPLAPLRALEDPDDAAIKEQLGSGAPAYLAYRTLRVRTVLDALSELGAELRDAQPDPSTDLPREIRLKLRRWIEAQPPGAHARFLTGYDGAFVQRRLSFLHDRVNDLLRRGPRAARMVAVARGNPLVSDEALPTEEAEALAEHAPALRALKLTLNEAVDQLRRAERAPHANVLENALEGEPLARFNAVGDAAQSLPEGHDAFMAAVGAFLAEPLADARQRIGAAIREAPDLPPWLCELLTEYDARFESYDMVVLPLAYPDLGETNSVGIVRISPLDAEGIAPGDEEIRKDPSRKLAGIRIAHFGGFLAESWRDNDLMWGRLDAADVIIDTLLGNDPRAAALREQAQAAILRQELRGDLRGEVEAAVGGPLDEATDPTLLISKFREAFRPLPGLDPGTRDDLAARSLKIGSDVLADAADGRGWPDLWLRGVGLAGRAVVIPVVSRWGRLKDRVRGLFRR